MLNPQQLDTIIERIDHSGFRLPDLRDDLLDHLCCIVEEEMESGTSFETACQIAMERLCPNGPGEIERETIFLLNIQKILRMKKFTYAIGLLASISVSIGYFMVLMRWPVGPEIFNYGFLALVLVFVPLLAYEQLQKSRDSQMYERMKLILGFSSAIIAGIGVAFKLMHLMGAGVLFGVGTLLFAFGFLPFLFFSLYKKSAQT
jgi:hypothetical protein